MNGTENLEVVDDFIGNNNILHHIIEKDNGTIIGVFETRQEAEKVLNSWRYADEMREALEDLLNKVQDHAHTLTPRDIINAANHAESILNKVK